MRCFWISALGLLCLIGPLTARAVDLYEAEVVVSDRSAAARSAALADALAQVLIKNTGNPAVTTLPGVQAWLGQAQSLAQQFSYGRQQRPLAQDDEPQFVLTLSARFPASTVNRILNEAGLARWGAQRPATLLWLAVETPDRGRVLVGEEQTAVISVLQRAAAERGLPIIVPLLDLADQRAVSMRELWGGFVEPVAAASRRYDTETFLLGRLEPGPDENWQGRWIIYDQGQQAYENVQGSMADVLSAGIDFAANTLGSRYAIAPGSRSRSGVLIAVHGVDSVRDYAELLDYFQSLSIVQSVGISMAKNDMLALRLELTAGLDRLDQVIALGRVLTAPQNRTGASITTAQAGGYQREYEMSP